MEKKYTQLTSLERHQLYLLHADGLSCTAIGKRLGRDKSTILRELKRNKSNGLYLPDTAQTLTKERRWRGCKIARNKELRDYICSKIAMESWSPLRISGKMKRDKTTAYACPETIYRFIYSPAGKPYQLYPHLFKAKDKRTAKQGRKPRKILIPNRISMHDRPEDATNRSEIGHWEGDLVQYQGQRENLLTMQDRHSRLILIAKNPSKKKENTQKMIRSRLKLFPEHARKTITFDNGGEFADHEKLNKINCKTFFCDPYASWQKGGLEHANGRIRRFLPKNTDLSTVSHKDIDNIQRKINNMPMKCLNFQTPTEVFLNNLNKRCTSN
jgi:transposase, IS30 family